VVELPFAADCCPCVEKLRTVVPLTVGIRDGAVQLVSILSRVQRPEGRLRSLTARSRGMLHITYVFKIIIWHRVISGFIFTFKVVIYRGLWLQGGCWRVRRRPRRWGPACGFQGPF
jgi:hypothetical protein